MRTLLRNSVPVSELNDELSSVLTRPGKLPVSLHLSDAIDSPSVIGFLRPVVVVPTSLWHELSACELKQVVQHEMAHLDRGDDWTNLLQKLLRSVFPLNPALFWAERELCVEREQACDDAVLDASGNARVYAICLTKLAETRMVRRMASLAPGFWQRQSELSGRVQNILHRRRALRPWFSGALIAGGMAASLSGAFFLQRFPGIVTFTSPEVVAASAPSRALPVSTASVQTNDQTLKQAHYQEAVFHPAVSQPKPHAPRRVHTTRQIQLLQIREDMDGQAITLVFYTVEAPRTSPHASTALPTSANWIAFQI
jgi:hypothetical protein